VQTETFSKQATVVSIIAIIMTFGVYGLVAVIVKLDDLGLYLMLKKAKVFIANYSAKLVKNYWQ